MDLARMLERFEPNADGRFTDLLMVVSTVSDH